MMMALTISDDKPMENIQNVIFVSNRYIFSLLSFILSAWLWPGVLNGLPNISIRHNNDMMENVDNQMVYNW